MQIARHVLSHTRPVEPSSSATLGSTKYSLGMLFDHYKITAGNKNHNTY